MQKSKKKSFKIVKIRIYLQFQITFPHDDWLKDA